MRVAFISIPLVKSLSLADIVYCSINSAANKKANINVIVYFIFLQILTACTFCSLSVYIYVHNIDEY
jgi:hypothetical protein